MVRYPSFSTRNIEQRWESRIVRIRIGVLRNYCSIVVMLSWIVTVSKPVGEGFAIQ